MGTSNQKILRSGFLNTGNAAAWHANAYSGLVMLPISTKFALCLCTVKYFIHTWLMRINHNIMKEMPVTVKRSLELLGVLLIVAVIYLGQVIIMPLLLAFFISLMLLPVYRLLRKFKIPEPIAIFLPILLLAIFIALIIWLFYSQVNFLIEDYAQIQANITSHVNEIVKWVSNTFGYSSSEQLKFIKEQSGIFFKSAGDFLGVAASSISAVLLFFGLLPIYIYLIILYKGILYKFIWSWAKPGEEGKVEDIIKKTEKMIKHYLVGLLIQISYIVLLLWGALALFGIKNALLIGVIFAFLNLIPYLGALVGNILGILITLATSGNLSDILIVLGVIAGVQFLDNNILMPKIVGSQVKINALASIVGLIIAGMVAGIPGMFLALPVMAVLKIIFNHFDQFKKWAVLLGDERPA